MGDEASGGGGSNGALTGSRIPVAGLSPEGDDVALVTPPRKAARSLRRRPLTTMDVDATLECTR